MIEEDKLKSISESRSISKLGASIKIIERLVDIDNFKSYVDSHEVLNTFPKYIKSLEFCICMCLNQIVDVLRHNQEFLDFEYDRLFIRAYEGEVPRIKFPDSTDLCRFVKNIYGLIDKIFKAKTHVQLNEITPKIKKYIIKTFYEIIYNDFELNDKFKNHNKDDFLLNLARNFIHSEFHDRNTINIAFGDIAKRGKDGNFQDNSKNIYDFMHATKDERRAGSLPETLDDQLFYAGFKVVISYLWSELFENAFTKYDFLSKIFLSKNWMEFFGYFMKIEDDIIIPLEKQIGMGDEFSEIYFNKKRPIVNETLEELKKELLFPEYNEKLNPNDELDEAFLWYPVNVIKSFNSIPCSNNFVLVLYGLLSFKDDPIFIIRFIHSNGDKSNFSYAILVEGPLYNLFGDIADWYLYFDFATNHSGTGRRAWRMVEDTLNEHGSKVKICECQISSIEFSEYIENKEIKDLSKKIEKIEDYNSKAKGMIFELINTYIFAKLDYKVHWALQGVFTGGKEIDLLAYKTNGKMLIEFYVIEVTTTGEDLVEEVKEKIRILKSNSSDLLKFLKLEGFSDFKFRGMVISNKKSNLQEDKTVEIINFKEMIKKLQNLRIDEKRLNKILDS